MRQIIYYPQIYTELQLLIMNLRHLFLQHIAQTSPSPLGLHIVKAKGTMLYDEEGKEYLDLIAGISVSNVGHRHPSVVKAIKKQVDAYLHVLVYGELIQSPQVEFARLLCDHLPSTLNSIYFTNSGAEATEGALKLAKRATGRTQILAFDRAYHGSTQGALSVMGSEYWRNAFRPLLPNVSYATFNSMPALEKISTETACVIVETIQGEAGVRVPDKDWLHALRAKCTKTGTLLIMDEIQTGFGRTGTFWAFEQFGIVPDILLLGKALGGGMPLGAFISSRDLMIMLSSDPVLGHITTFGGHPVCCAAGNAALRVLLKEQLITKVHGKEKLFRNLLKHEKIREIRSAGLLIAVQFFDAQITQKVITYCLEHGLLSDWFLFAPDCLRIAPPLTIKKQEIRKACKIILEGLEQA